MAIETYEDEQKRRAIFPKGNAPEPVAKPLDRRPVVTPIQAFQDLIDIVSVRVLPKSSYPSVDQAYLTQDSSDPQALRLTYDIGKHELNEANLSKTTSHAGIIRTLVKHLRNHDISYEISGADGKPLAPDAPAEAFKTAKLTIQGEAARLPSQLSNAQMSVQDEFASRTNAR